MHDVAGRQRATRPRATTSNLLIGSMADLSANTAQQDLDLRNEAFWNELCGSALAREIGITGHEPDALEQFDRAYLGLYPYLLSYVDRFSLRGKRVLEIGLGYGTLGEAIARRGAEYEAVDLASAPVELMRMRLARMGRDPNTARQASALALPYPDGRFDFVYTIGTLHHTGDLRRGVAEVHRVLRPGGTAVVMVYNRHSLRQLVHLARARGRLTVERAKRLVAAYDSNETGAGAPHTDFSSRRDVRRLFAAFEDVRIEVRNFDPIVWRNRVLVPRERLLGNVDRILGLDLYVIARKG